MNNEIVKIKVTGNSSSRVIQRDGDGQSYFTGAVATPYGFVVVHAEDGYANVSFIYNGIEYRKTFRHWMSKQALAIAAGRLVKEIVNEK